MLREVAVFRRALLQARTAECSRCRATAVADGSAAWARGGLFSPAYNAELATEIFDAADYAWEDSSYSQWDRAVLRLSLLYLLSQLGLKAATPRVARQLAAAVIRTLTQSGALAPNPVDSLVVHWTCLFCVSRPNGRWGRSLILWREDASRTADALAQLQLLGHAKALSQEFGFGALPRKSSPRQPKDSSTPAGPLREVREQIQGGRFLAPQMRLGIPSLLQYLNAAAGSLRIVKTPLGQLGLRS